MKKKEFLWSLLSVLMVGLLSTGIVVCGSDDDDEGTTVPSELIGTWNKVSGADKYSMNFTFNSDAVFQKNW